MSHYLTYSGLRKSVLSFAATVYGFVAGVTDWMWDLSDENNSFYVALM